MKLTTCTVTLRQIQLIPELGSARRTPSVLLYYKFNLSGSLLTRVDLLTTVGLGTAFGAVDTQTLVFVSARESAL